MSDLKSEPLTEAEIEEFLAEKLLGWELKGTPERWTNGNIFYWRSEIKRFIYSPEGFFAVWDVVEKMPQVTFVQFINEPEYRVYIDTYDGTQLNGEGKDRYEAFYNAVIEVMKDE